MTRGEAAGLAFQPHRHFTEQPMQTQTFYATSDLNIDKVQIKKGDVFATLEFPVGVPQDVAIRTIAGSKTSVKKPDPDPKSPIDKLVENHNVAIAALKDEHEETVADLQAKLDAANAQIDALKNSPAPSTDTHPADQK
jgi:hypothetical protein